MNEIHDPRLDALFNQACEPLDNDAFTDRVMNRSRFLKYRLHALAGGITLLLIVLAQILVPPLRDVSLMLAWGLTTNLIDLGDGWLAWLASPVNTIGGVVALCFKGMLMLRKWVRGGIDLR
jgi:hypothetical protein